MAVKDQASQMDGYIVINEDISTDTTTVGPVFDMADHECGITFMITCPDALYTDGTYTLLLEESDDSGMSGSAVVPAAKLIGSLPAISAGVADGAIYEKVGVFSNLRYVRASIVSTSTTTGATVAGIVLKGSEVVPT